MVVLHWTVKNGFSSEVSPREKAYQLLSRHWFRGPKTNCGGGWRSVFYVRAVAAVEGHLWYLHQPSGYRRWSSILIIYRFSREHVCWEQRRILFTSKYLATTVEIFPEFFTSLSHFIVGPNPPHLLFLNSFHHGKLPAFIPTGAPQIPKHLHTFGRDAAGAQLRNVPQAPYFAEFRESHVTFEILIYCALRSGCVDGRNSLSLCTAPTHQRQRAANTTMACPTLLVRQPLHIFESFRGWEAGFPLRAFWLRGVHPDAVTRPYGYHHHFAWA